MMLRSDEFLQRMNTIAPIESQRLFLTLSLSLASFSLHLTPQAVIENKRRERRLIEGDECYLSVLLRWNAGDVSYLLLFFNSYRINLPICIWCLDLMNFFNG